MGASSAPAGRQFSLYLLAGGLAALANWGSRFVFSVWLPFEVAVLAAFCVGMCTGFLLMRRYAFAGSQQSLPRQALGYLLVNLLAALQTVVISSVLLRLVLPPQLLGLSAEAVAHGAGVVAPVLTSYFGHRWISFR